jgi:HAD superfamily hydrolase (TIGR01509 family)
MIKAVIFDMDGLMVNTEPIQNIAFSWLIEREHKKPIYHSNGLVHQVGINEKENVQILQSKYNLTGTLDNLVEQRALYYQNLLKSHVIPMPGLIEFITELRKSKIMLAVASSSIKENIMYVLKALKISQCFNVVVSGVEVSHGKPAPDIFLEAAKRLDTEPIHCVVIGDAENDVIAAKKANMAVIAVPNQYTANHDFSSANKVLHSLNEVTVSLIKSL